MQIILIFFGDVSTVWRVHERFLSVWSDCPMQSSICWYTSRFKSKCSFGDIKCSFNFIYVKLWNFIMGMYNADLKTMSKRVESELYYVTFDMFVADVRRMFANARTYNSPETIYYKCATRQVYCSSMLQLFLFFFPFCFFYDHFMHICIQAWITFLKQSSSWSTV